MLQVEAIEYDPLKEKLGQAISHSAAGRKLFYAVLNLLFLRAWHIRRELKKIAKQHEIADVLDAGMGYGQYTYMMSKLWPHSEILGIDVKVEQIHDCRWFMHRIKKRHVRFEYGDLTEFERSEQFDLAVSVDVMEHILDDEAVYRNVYASLRPGGFFLINTPATNKESSHVNPESVIGEHVREGYTQREFIHKMHAAGFRVEKLRRTYHPFWGRIAWYIFQRIPMKLLSVSRLLAVVVVPFMIVFSPLAFFSMWMDLHTESPGGGGWVMLARKPQHGR